MASGTATIRSDYFHPQHMLAAYNYSNASSYTCAACELVVTGAGYRCGECDGFNIHKACFTGLPGSISLQGGEHDRPWALTYLDSSRPCLICDKTSHAGRYMYMLSGDGGGVCLCMHPRCVLTSSPYLHPQHSLAPYDYGTRSSSSTKCAACELVVTGVGCRCAECDFNIHLDCSSLPGSVSFRKHSQHELSLTRLGASRWCDICKETSLAGAYMYRCVPCDYDVHPRCRRHTTLRRLRRHFDSGTLERIRHVVSQLPDVTQKVVQTMASNGGACAIM